MRDYDEVDIKRKNEGEDSSCTDYAECSVAPIAFSCIAAIPPGFETGSIEDGGNATIINDCTYLSKSVIWNPNSKITIPGNCNCSDCSLPYPAKIRQIKVKGGVQINLYTFITGRPLGADGKPSVHHSYDDTTVACGQATVCIDSVIAYSAPDCIPNIEYELAAYFQNAEMISNSAEEKIARLNGNLYVYILPQST